MADGDTRIVTMFIFGESGLTELPGLFDLIEHHNRTGKWIEVTKHIEPRSGTLNGQANLRSEPLAAPETFVAALAPGKLPPLRIVGEENDYYRCELFLWKKRVDVK